MKQKIVIKVSVQCDKCRTKAMTVAAAADGVSSVALEGYYKDKMVVIGEGVDAAELTKTLRKKVNYVTLETVEEVKAPVVKKDKGADKDKKDQGEDEDKMPERTPIPPSCPSRCELYQVVYDPYPTTTCTTM